MNIIFFRLAFRNILKNKVSSSINIIGFSIGIAACLFIYLFVNYEMSFDTFYPNADKLFRVVSIQKSNKDIYSSGFVWLPIAKDLKNEIPGIDDFCRVSKANKAKLIEDNQVWKINKLRYADDNFFKFFNYKLRYGNPENILKEANQIVLTERKAAQIFGNVNPIGKTLFFNNKLFTVSGVAANPLSNTQLIFEAIIPVKYVELSKQFWKGYGGGITFLSYLQLSKNVTPQQIEKLLPNFFDKKINKRWESTGFSIDASLQNIRDVHLSDGLIDYDISTNRSKKSVYIIVCISLLILLLAIVNYIILYTAQKITKVKDLRILKIFGAKNYNLIVQSFIEVFIIASIASIFGIILLYVSLSFLNTLLQTSIAVEEHYNSVIPFLLLIIFILSFVVTFFSSQKIRFKNSSLSTKNNPSFTGFNKSRSNTLVSFQFVIVIVLLIAVLVIFRQNKYLLNSELGFNKENILTFIPDNELSNNELISFKQDLLQLSGIQSISLSSQIIGQGLTQNGYAIGKDNENTMINALYTDADFLKCFDIKLLSGRNFSINNQLDKNAILINQKLAKRTGWKNPINKEIHRNGDLKIIGVVNNFNFASLENTVQPLIIMSNPQWDGWEYEVANIRYRTTDIQLLINQIRKIWQNSHPEIPFEISFLDEELATNYASLTLQQTIISFFSFVAILIAVIGLFGLTFFVTHSRFKEIGIRKVNGASITDIMILLNKEFLKSIVISSIIAIPIAYYIMHRWLENFAYKTLLSWWIFILVGLVTLCIAIFTTSWQSYKAAKRNPVETLKEE